MIIIYFTKNDPIKASYCVFIPSFNSYQMCLEAKSENEINPMILIIFNVTVVPLLFATPGVVSFHNSHAFGLDS